MVGVAEPPRRGRSRTSSSRGSHRGSRRRIATDESEVQRSAPGAGSRDFGSSTASSSASRTTGPPSRSASAGASGTVGKRRTRERRWHRARSGTAARLDRSDSGAAATSEPPCHRPAPLARSRSTSRSIRPAGDSHVGVEVVRRDRPRRGPATPLSARRAGLPTHDRSARPGSKTPMNSIYESPSQTTRLNVPSESWRPPPVGTPPTACSNCTTAASGSATAITRWSMPKCMAAA